MKKDKLNYNKKFKNYYQNFNQNLMNKHIYNLKVDKKLKNQIKIFLINFLNGYYLYYLNLKLNQIVI